MASGDGSGVERTHADLERYHYQALKDPRYAAALLQDEAMMAMAPPLTTYDPGREFPELFDAKYDDIVQIFNEVRWAKRQWGYVRQIEAKVGYLQNKINEHLLRHKKGDTDKATGVIQIEESEGEQAKK